MGELSQEALRAEFKRATEGEDQKSSKSKSLWQIADRDAWAASFAQYAGVVCRSHRCQLSRIYFRDKNHTLATPK